MLTALRSRTHLTRLIIVCLIIILATPPVISAITYDASARSTLETGTITNPANGSTVISAQGFTFRGNTNKKKPARLVAVERRGDLKWTHTDNVGGSAWFYDVDPLPNGNLLVSSPRAGETVVFEFNRTTKTRVWEKRFAMEDTHDVDYLGENRFVIANMREWNNSADVSDDRVSFIIDPRMQSHGNGNFGISSQQRQTVDIVKIGHMSTMSIQSARIDYYSHHEISIK